MASKSVHSEMCIHMGTMITNQLCECDEETTGCPYQVIFGDGHFCTCRLESFSGRSAHKQAYFRESRCEQWDS